MTVTVRSLAAGLLLLAISACSAPAPETQRIVTGAGGVATAAPDGAPGDAAGDAPGDAATSAPLAGWYMEHAGRGSLLPCGGAAAVPILVSGELPDRARAFGLQDDLPVYVRVHATLRNGSLLIDSVDQFGSPTPVRDCAMTGVVSGVVTSNPSATH